MAERVKLIELDVDFEQLIKNGAQAKKSFDELKIEAIALQKSIKENDKVVNTYKQNLETLEKQGKKGTKQYKLEQEALKSLAKTQDTNRQKLELIQTNLRKQQKLYRVNQKGIDSYNKTKQREHDIYRKTDGSIKQLEHALALNKNAYRELSKEERENEKVGGRLLRLINQQDEEYKNLQKSIGTTQVDVGNYRGQIRELLNENINLSATFKKQIEQIPILGQFLGGLFGALIKTSKAQKGLAVSTSFSTKALKLFRIALISTGIGAIVVALGALIAYLASAQGGINKVNKFLIPLKIIFQSLFGVLQHLGEIMFDAFSNPQESIKALWESIKTNIVNRISGIGKIFKSLGKIISSGFTDGYKDLANATLQTSTGVEDVIGKVQKLASEAGKFLSEAYKRGLRIAEIQEILSAGEADYIKKVAEGKEAFKAQNKIAEDTTKTLTERENAALESLKTLKGINELQRERNALELESLLLKAESNDTTDEDRAEIAQKVAELREANTQLLEAETTQQNKLNTIRREAAQKAIAIAQKKANAALKLYTIENDSINASLEERVDYFKNILKKEKDILKQQLKNKSITQEEYELAILEKKKEYLAKVNKATAEHLTQELDLYLVQNRSKIENDTLLNDKIVADEEARLKEIHSRKLELLEQQRESEAITEQDFLARKLELQYGYLEQQRNLEDQFKAQKADQEALEYQNEFEIKRLRGESEFQLRYEALERQKKIELENAKKKGLDLEKIETKYSLKRGQITKAEQEAKLAGAEAVLDGLSNLLGKETVAGKAVAIAKATMDTYKAANLALSTYPPPFGAIAAGTAIVAGITNVKKIASTKADVPKAERGAVFDIGGNRHSSGGTKFYGEDGTAFEAEQGEKLFVLNRQASAAIAPLLNDINRKHGGASLYTSRTHLAVGGGVLRNTNVQQAQGINYDVLADKISEANRQLPNPVVMVEDINTGQSSVAEVKQYASLGA